MKRFFVTLALISLVAGYAVAADPDFCYYPNEIGLYVTESPASMDDAMTPTTFGLVQVYLVISNPYNTNRMQPIANMGGYECTLDFPGAWGIFGDVTLPPNTLNLSQAGFPEFYVAGTFPTSGGCFTTLASFQLANFTTESGPIFMTPVGAPSIAGSIAITDADYDFELLEAFPISGDLALPIFGIGLSVVDNDDVSLGDVKALYR
jgi:hypothetical protein